MSRRFLHVGLLAVFLVLSGCTGTPTTTPAPTPTATEAPSDAYTPYAAELRIENPSEYTVTVETYAQTDAGETLAVNRTTDARRIDLDDTFKNGVNYRVVVRVNGTEQWNETVFDYEGVTLLVTEEGTVRVDSFIER